MHFYPHNIKEFNNATRHLTRVERSVYRDAIDLYYDKEKPLPFDFSYLARLLLVRTDEEKNALKTILSEFFYLDEDVYRHDKCDFEIVKYQANSTAKAKAGRASAEARRKKKEEAKQKNEQTSNTSATELNTCSTERQQNSTNQEPRTNNQDNNKNTMSSAAPKTDYENKFQIFWKQFPRDLGSKGSKQRAYLEFIKLKPDKTLFTKMLTTITDQAACKRNTRHAGQFTENFRHVERWIKYKGWDDELPESQPYSLADQAPAMRLLTDRSWSDGILGVKDGAEVDD